MPPQKVKDIPGCAGCPLATRFPSNNFVPFNLRPGNRLAIAEAPGQEESAEGEPLVGGTGRMLRGLKVKQPSGEYIRYGGLLGEAGIKESNISFGNVIQCRPPSRCKKCGLIFADSTGSCPECNSKDLLTNTFPSDPKAKFYISKSEAESAIQHCIQWHVKPVLESRTWQRIDLIGGKSLKYLGGKNEGIESWRGSPISIPILAASGDNRLVGLPTIHPAALMRSQELMPAVVNDLKKSLVIPPEYYTLAPDIETVRNFKFKRFAFDIENNWPVSREITMVGLCGEKFKVLVVPFTPAFKKELQRIFSEAEEVIGHNCIQFDIPELAKDGVNIRPDCRVIDTMLRQHLIQPGMPHDLTFVGSIFTSKPTWEFEKKSSGMELYNARDVDVTFQAEEQLKPTLTMYQLDNLYDNVQVPLARICKLMKDTGISIDTNKIESVREKLKIEMSELESHLPDSLRTCEVQVNKRAPAPPGTMNKSGKKPLKFITVPATKLVIPWNSPDKVAEYLYETCKLPEEKDLKTESITTGKIALAKIARRVQNGTYKPENSEEIYKAITAIQKLRQLDELNSNFCQEEYLGLKKIHTSFNVHGTESGRLSSSNPNLQNVPKSARFMYVPSHSNWKLVSFDFSGLENRITAYLAGDSDRLARFDSKPSFSEHKYAVELFYGIPYDEVIKDNDRNSPYGRCKAIVHGCFGPGHEVLTPEGWQKLEDLSLQPTAMVWNSQTREFSFEKTTLFQAPGEGSLFHWQGRTHEFYATSRHGMPLLYGYQDSKVRRATVEELNNSTAKLAIAGTYKPKGLPLSIQEIQQAVAIQADATLYDTKAVFHLVKRRKQKRLEQLFDTIGEPCGCHKTGKRYRITYKSILLDSDKTFTLNILELNQEQRTVFLSELLYWDGTRGREPQYINTNKKCIDLVQTLAALDGRNPLVRKRSKGSGHFGTKDVYSVSFFKRKGSKIEAIDKKEVSYTGKVYCLETSTGYFLVRYNNRIFISGNTDRGEGSRKIALLNDIPESEIKPLHAQWKAAIPATIQYQQYIAKKAEKDGYLTNPFGRKWWGWGNRLYTQSISFMPQSTGADVVYRVMIGLMYERINWPLAKVQEVVGFYSPLPEPARLLLQVHDELVFEMPEDMVEEVSELIVKVAMQPWPELGGLILPVNRGVGDCWAEMD